MSTSATVKPSPRASRVEFPPDILRVTLVDGRTLDVPIEWFPRLRDATSKDLQEYILMGDGSGIHWPALDEDLSVAGLLGI